MPIDGAQIAVFIGPFIPDGHTVVLQILDIRITGNEPQQLIYDGLEVNLLVVSSGNPSDRSKRIWYPNTLCVPTPVRSCFTTPSFLIWRNRSRYCLISSYFLTEKAKTIAWPYTSPGLRTVEG